MVLIRTVDLLFQIYMVMLIVRILSSWFPEAQRYRFIQYLTYYTDPYLNLFRKIIPPLGIFDLSPIVAFFVLQIVHNLLLALLVHFLTR